MTKKLISWVNWKTIKSGFLVKIGSSCTYTSEQYNARYPLKQNNTKYVLFFSETFSGVSPAFQAFKIELWHFCMR